MYLVPLTLLIVNFNRMVALTKSQKAKYCMIFNLLTIFFILSACDNSSIDYISKVPNSGSYEYISIYEWGEIHTSTLHIDKIYEAKSDTQAFLGLIGFIEEINDSTLWVADPARGEVTEVDIRGKNVIRRKPLNNGEGPNEVLRPSSIFFTGSIDSPIYVMDSGQSCIMIVTSLGFETKRNCSPNIPVTSLSIYLKVPDPNTYLWNTIEHEQYVLAEWDSSGNFKKGLVERLIPVGFQPRTYNNLVYSMDNNRTNFVYAYTGLPLIFVETNGRKALINLLPSQQLHEFNVPLDLRSDNTNIGVKGIIRDIHIIHDKIYVSLLTSLLVIDLNQKEDTKEYIFKNMEGDEVKFHMFSVTKNNLYIVDRYNKDIYLTPRQ